MVTQCFNDNKLINNDNNLNKKLTKTLTPKKTATAHAYQQLQPILQKSTLSTFNDLLSTQTALKAASNLSFN